MLFRYSPALLEKSGPSGLIFLPTRRLPISLAIAVLNVWMMAEFIVAIPLGCGCGPAVPGCLGVFYYDLVVAKAQKNRGSSICRM